MSDSSGPPNSNEADPAQEFARLPTRVVRDQLETLKGGVLPPVERIGNYRLVMQLGSGGMGEVWLAQHIENRKLQAAVKFIRPDHVDPGIHGRFHRERDLLVRLRHENIVKVSDLGVTPNGLPYLLMEYVHGESLVAYCDKRRLSVPRRLELFLQVCRAVQHAHRQGLIHRDLKPANILVTEVEEDGKVRPVAKVIDFGIARAMETNETTEIDVCTTGSGENDPLLTQPGMFIGSLLYASPEQLLTQPIDVRTDVYSLGAILYQLLSGTLPITAREAQAMLREAKAKVIVHQFSTTRLPPSEKIRTEAKTNPKKLLEWAEARGVLADQLARILVNELDWITLKAIESDREQRYGSVEALAADLERYLHDEVVEARKPDLKYRVGKIWRRKRKPILAMALLVLALATGLSVVQEIERKSSARQISADRAREEAQKRFEEELAKSAEQ